MMTGPTQLPAPDERWALTAGVVFLEEGSGWGPTELRRWFTEHLVGPGHMTEPAAVHEAPIGAISLWSRGAPLPGASPITRRPSGAEASPPLLLARTRSQVLSGLRGFLAVPINDGFVSAAIFAGRVQRVRGRWHPRPDAAAPLSALVLSLFAVDALTHRDAWDQRLSICDACGRLSFTDAAEKRRVCPAHAPPRVG
jgi:hypothetical protein